MKNDNEPIFEEGVVPLDKNSSKQLPDKYKFTKLVRLDQRVFIPIGDRIEENLRQNINQHKRKFESRSANQYTIRKMVLKGRPGFAIQLVDQNRNDLDD